MTRFGTCLALAAAMLLWLWQPDARAETRVALLIGNGAYQGVGQLPNPRKDAGLLAEALQKAGFRVRIQTDLTGEAMRRALRDFASDAEQADWAVVYFAGHGLEMGGQNYLVPVDARMQVDRDVPFETVGLDQVLQAVDGARKLRLVIIDACRNNPFLAQMGRTSAVRSMERGLARVEPEGGTLVAYAAKNGQVALDGDGQNSPFVTALVKAVNTQGLELNKVFRAVRDDVMTQTGRRQEPYVYGSLPSEDFYFVPPQQAAAATTAAPQARPEDAAVQAEFLQARSLGTPAAWDAFLGRHATGFYADLARTERDRLAAAVAAAAAPKPVQAAAGAARSEPAPAVQQVAGPGTPDHYLRGYAGDDCFAARASGPGSADPDPTPRVEAFGVRPATFQALDQDFKARFGTEARIKGRLVTAPQCGAVKLMKTAAWGREQGPQIYLSRTLVRAGQPLAGVVSNLGSRTSLALLILSDDGRVYEATPSLARQGDVATFSAALSLPPGSQGKPQLAIAVATDRPLAGLGGPGPVPADKALPALARELGGEPADIAVAYWRYTLSPPPAAGKPWTP